MLDGRGQGAVPPLNQAVIEEGEIENFERLVVQRRHEAATRHLLAMLERLYRIYREPGQIVTPEVERYRYTRLAAAVGALLADPTYVLSESGFASLALQHSTLGHLFAASAFGGADHLATLVGTRNLDRPEKVDYGTRQQMLKLLLCRSLDSRIELDLERLLRAEPQRLLPLYLGMLNRYIVLTPAAHRQRELLLDLGDTFEACTPSMQCLPSLAVAWMNCMYATGTQKLSVKRSLNKMAAALVQPPVPPVASRAKSSSKRPVMLVVIEDMRSGHVNHRTFGPLLGELREGFTLTGAATAGSLDQGSRQLFDHVVEVSAPGDEGSLSALVKQLAELKADIAYYPTVGAQPWCIVTATQRLAPIQVATMGVPASTRSPAMDYVVIEESWAGDADLYSEIVVQTRSGSTRFFPRAGAALKRPAPRRTDPRRDAVRIAIPAIAPKLSLPFLQTCAQIASASRVPLEWYFLAGLTGLQHTVVADRVRHLIPEARVFPNLDYRPYMHVLGDCDLQLSSFPFGGMNTIFDSLFLGLPIVTLEGRQPHERSDAGMMRRAMLPEWLIARSEIEYAEVALRLIHDAAARRKLRNQLLKTSLDAAFLSGKAGHERDYLDAFRWIHDNHDSLQRAGRRCWTVAERESQRRK